jgi:hypothetical protein
VRLAFGTPAVNTSAYSSSVRVVTLGEKSYAGCAVAAWRDQLHVAWTGRDYRINVAASPDGRTLAHARRLKEKSYARMRDSSDDSGRTIALAPSLAVAGDRLVLGWTGADGRPRLVTYGGEAEPAPVTVPERTARPVGLAGAEDLVLAWIGTDQHVNLVTPGRSAPVRLDEARTTLAPALCSHRGGLVLAWVGTDRRVNVRTLPDGPYALLEQARTSAPVAVCSHRGEPVLAWAGTDRVVNLLRLTGSSTPVQVAEARTGERPGLCMFRDELVLAWTGTNYRLNLGHELPL